MNRKQKCGGKFELDTRRIVSDFGGITNTARLLRASGNDVSEGAVDVWRRRKSMNMTSLCHLMIIANMSGQKFDLLDYIKPKTMANSVAEGDQANNGEQDESRSH